MVCSFCSFHISQIWESACALRLFEAVHNFHVSHVDKTAWISSLKIICFRHIEKKKPHTKQWMKIVMRKGCPQCQCLLLRLNVHLTFCAFCNKWIPNNPKSRKLSQTLWINAFIRIWGMSLSVTCSFVFPNLFCTEGNFTGKAEGAVIQFEL